MTAARPPMMTGQEWIITIENQHLERIDDVVTELEALGLHAQGVLRSLGQVTGSTHLTQDSAEAVRHSLASVTGVASVDDSRQWKIAPPDDPVQ